MIFFLIAAVVVGGIFLEAWAFMIAVGTIHAEWLTMMPTIGYNSSLICSFVIVLVYAPFWLANGALEGAK